MHPYEYTGDGVLLLVSLPPDNIKNDTGINISMMANWLRNTTTGEPSEYQLTSERIHKWNAPIMQDNNDL